MQGKGKYLQQTTSLFSMWCATWTQISILSHNYNAQQTYTSLVHDKVLLNKISRTNLTTKTKGTHNPELSCHDITYNSIAKNWSSICPTLHSHHQLTDSARCRAHKKMTTNPSKFLTLPHHIQLHFHHQNSNTPTLGRYLTGQLKLQHSLEA